MNGYASLRPPNAVSCATDLREAMPHGKFPVLLFSRCPITIEKKTHVESTCLICGEVIIETCNLDGTTGIEAEEFAHAAQHYPHRNPALTSGNVTLSFERGGGDGSAANPVVRAIQSLGRFGS